MTDYQINLVVNAYFNKLIELGINENMVLDFGQRKGELFIKLENKEKKEQIITEKIKNFYN